MIEPAKRLSEVNEYYFSNKLREIAALRATGLNILNLGIGNPDLPPSGETINELKNKAMENNRHGYQSYNGDITLRSAFAKWYRKYFNVSLDPENEILPLIGSKEGIMHISMAFLDPGDSVLIPDPSYPAYRSVAKLLGAKIIDYNLTKENGWFPDFNEIEKHDLSKVKMMWVNYPNMPTGKTIDKEQFAKIVEFGRKHRILICNDNPYSFILNSDYTSIFQVPGAFDVAIELNSLSKSHNMAGWRIGALISNPKFVNHVLTVKSNVDSGMFQPMQLAAVKALESPESWYKNLNIIYQKRKNDAVEILRNLSCRLNEEQSGMFLWAEIPLEYTDSYQFTDYILNRFGLFITPGQIFGNNGSRYIRISLASKEADLKEAISRLTLKTKAA